MSQIEKTFRNAYSLARAVARNPGLFPDSFIALPLVSPAVQRLVSSERLWLLRKLREQGGFESVSKLAVALRRDQGVVSRDIEILAEAALVVVDRHGKRDRVTAPNHPIVLA